VSEYHKAARWAIKIGEQDRVGSGERGLPVGTRRAAVEAREKVEWLGCPLCSNADDEVQQGR
jgi:hypothetical protein